MDINDPSTWPPELDALIAAPEHHTLVFENDHVRVLITKIPPGEMTKVHTHRWPAVVHFLSRGSFVRRSDTGEVLFDSRTVPASDAIASWGQPLAPHTFENVGDSEIRVLNVEIKTATV